jgi:hypothetical protein
LEFSACPFVPKADISAPANSRYSITSSARARPKRNGEAGRFSGLEIDRQSVLGRRPSVLAVRIAGDGFATRQAMAYARNASS